MIDENQFNSTVDDISADLAKQSIIKYTTKNWLTGAEAEDLYKAILDSAKSSITIAMKGFFNFPETTNTTNT